MFIKFNSNMNSAIFRPPQALDENKKRLHVKFEPSQKLNQMIRDLSKEKEEYRTLSSHLSETAQSVSSDNEKLKIT